LDPIENPSVCQARATELLEVSPGSAHIALVHGAMSSGDWQGVASKILIKYGLSARPHNSGWLWPFDLTSSRARDSAITAFEEWYTREFLYHRIIPSVVAHSFGTYIVAMSLLRSPLVKFDSVILCGSVVDRSYPWKAVLGKQVRKARNEIAPGDKWVPLTELLIPNAGASGTRGFVTRHPALTEVSMPRGDHSAFFTDSHVAQEWIPYLLDGPRYR
jgi:serine/threonine-protein kinase